MDDTDSQFHVGLGCQLVESATAFAKWLPTVHVALLSAAILEVLLVMVHSYLLPDPTVAASTGKAARGVRRLHWVREEKEKSGGWGDLMTMAHAKSYPLHLLPPHTLSLLGLVPAKELVQVGWGLLEIGRIMKGKWNLNLLIAKIYNLPFWNGSSLWISFSSSTVFEKAFIWHTESVTNIFWFG